MCRLNDGDAEDDFENLDNPIAGKEKDKANNSPSDSLFTFGLAFWASWIGEHGKATSNEHNQKKKATKDDGDSEDAWESAVTAE